MIVLSCQGLVEGLTTSLGAHIHIENYPNKQQRSKNYELGFYWILGSPWMLLQVFVGKGIMRVFVGKGVMMVVMHV